MHRWQVGRLRLGSFDPVSTLTLPSTTCLAACMPVIDFHAHLGRWLTPDGGWMERDVGQLIDIMESCGIAAIVNLDGRWGRELQANLDRYDRAHPDRFYTFCHLDWRLLDRPDGPQLLVRSLEQSVDAGARGLKVWKDLSLGLTVRGREILLDDPRLDPVWGAASSLRIPVLIHVADPVAFFQPVDERNERLEQLTRHPRLRQRGGLPRFYKLLDSFESVVASNPETVFVAAHALHSEDLAYVARLLESYQNLYIDIGWRAQEIGRQPRTAASLISRHQERTLFGTDAFPAAANVYRAYFRVLESEDEAFSYPDAHFQMTGRWYLYGLGLGLEVLKKVYQDNARRLLGLPLSTKPLGVVKEGLHTSC